MAQIGTLTINKADMALILTFIGIFFVMISPLFSYLVYEDTSGTIEDGSWNGFDKDIRNIVSIHPGWLMFIGMCCFTIIPFFLIKSGNIGFLPGINLAVGIIFLMIVLVNAADMGEFVDDTNTYYEGSGFEAYVGGGLGLGFLFSLVVIAGAIMQIRSTEESALLAGLRGIITTPPYPAVQQPAFPPVPPPPSPVVPVARAMVPPPPKKTPPPRPVGMQQASGGKDAKLEQANNFEKALRFEDAAKIYEELGMWDEAGDMRRKKIEFENQPTSVMIEGVNIDQSTTIQDSVISKSTIGAEDEKE